MRVASGVFITRIMPSLLFIVFYRLTNRYYSEYYMIGGTGNFYSEHFNTQLYENMIRRVSNSCLKYQQLQNVMLMYALSGGV